MSSVLTLIRGSASEQVLFQSIVDSALAATQVRLVTLVLSEPGGLRGRVVAHAGIGSGAAQTAIAAVRRLHPEFDPSNITVELSANPTVRPVYEEGQAVSAPFTAISAGNAAQYLLDVAATVIGIHWSHVHPLLVGGRVAGTLSFHGGAELSESMRGVCEAFASQASLTLEHAHLAAQERHRAQQAEQLAGVLASVGAAPDISGALEALAWGVLRLLDATRGQARLFPANGALRVRVASNGLVTRDRANTDYAPGTFGAIVRDGGPAQLIQDFWALDPATYPLYDRMKSNGFRSALCVPIVSGGARIGVLHADHSAPSHFSHADLSLAEALAAQAGAVVERQQAQNAAREAQEKQAKMDGALLVARTVAHEINNALAPLSGYAELLTLRPGGPQAETYAGLIVASAADLASKVARLQQIVRLEETTSPLGPERPVLDMERSTNPSIASDPVPAPPEDQDRKRPQTLPASAAPQPA